MEKDIASWLQGHLDAAEKLIRVNLIPLFHAHGMPGVERELRQALYSLNSAHRALQDVAPALKAAADATSIETKAEKP